MIDFVTVIVLKSFSSAKGEVVAILTWYWGTGNPVNPDGGMAAGGMAAGGMAAGRGGIG